MATKAKFAREPSQTLSQPIIGRKRELSRARTALAAGKTLVIVGPSGIGKSSLAKELVPTAVWVSAESVGSIPTDAPVVVDDCDDSSFLESFAGRAIVVLAQSDSVFARGASADASSCMVRLAPLDPVETRALDRASAMRRDIAPNPRAFSETCGVPALVCGEVGATDTWFDRVSPEARAVACVAGWGDGLFPAVDTWLANSHQAVAALEGAALIQRTPARLVPIAAPLWVDRLAEDGIRLMHKLLSAGIRIRPLIVANGLRYLLGIEDHERAEKLAAVSPYPKETLLGPRSARHTAANHQQGLDWCELSPSDAELSARAALRFGGASREAVDSIDRLGAAALRLVLETPRDGRETLRTITSELRAAARDPLELPEVAIASLQLTTGEEHEKTIADIMQHPVHVGMCASLAEAYRLAQSGDRVGADQLLSDVGERFAIRHEATFADVARGLIPKPVQTATSSQETIQVEIYRGTTWQNLAMSDIDFAETDLAVDLIRDMLILEGGAVRSRGRPTACALLAELVVAGGVPIAPAELFQALRGSEYHPLKHRNTLYVTINRVRHHLRSLAGETIRIETTSSGWRLDGLTAPIVIREVGSAASG